MNYNLLMGPQDVLKGIGEGALESENIGIGSLGTKTLERDAKILEGLAGEKTPKLTEKIIDHLEKNGRPGSAEYMDVFFRSAVLDKELELLEQGGLNQETIKQSELPLMVSLEKTTPNMVAAGEAYLTETARTEFLGSAHGLRYKLDQHINKTIQQASEHYSNELTRDYTLSEKVKALLEIRAQPYEIPFNASGEEIAKLEELSQQSFISRKETQQKMQEELENMMRNRPGLIGLETTASTSEFLKEITDELSGLVAGPVEVNKLRNLHKYLSGQGMEELQIYDGFGKAIEDRIDQDFLLTSIKKPAAESIEQPRIVAKPEVVYTSGEWLVEDIDEETKAWLLQENQGDVSREYTPEEEEKAHAFADEMFNEATHRSETKQEGAPDPLEAFKKVEKDEEDHEGLKLLLRITIKVGTKVAVSIARNMSKDKDVSQEMRVTLGVFADLADESGKLADKLIVGDSHPDLERDCINYLKSRFTS